MKGSAAKERHAELCAMQSTGRQMHPDGERPVAGTEGGMTDPAEVNAGGLAPPGQAARAVAVAAIRRWEDMLPTFLAMRRTGRHADGKAVGGSLAARLPQLIAAARKRRPLKRQVSP